MGIAARLINGNVWERTRQHACDACSTIDQNGQVIAHVGDGEQTRSMIELVLTLFEHPNIAID